MSRLVSIREHHTMHPSFLNVPLAEHGLDCESIDGCLCDGLSPRTCTCLHSLRILHADKQLDADVQRTKVVKGRHMMPRTFRTIRPCPMWRPRINITMDVTSLLYHSIFYHCHTADILITAKGSGSAEWTRTIQTIVKPSA